MPDASSEACKRTRVPYGSANLCCRHASCIMERATYAVPTNRTVVNASPYFSLWTSQWGDRPYCRNDKKNSQQHKTLNACSLRRCMFSHFSPLLGKLRIFSTHPPTPFSVSCPLPERWNRVSRIWMEVNRATAETGEGLYFDEMGHWFEWWKLGSMMGLSLLDNFFWELTAVSVHEMIHINYLAIFCAANPIVSS